MGKNNRITFALFSFCFFVFCSLSAQYTFTAQVIDEQSNRPIPFAKIDFQETPYTVISDENGFFSLSLTTERTLTVEAAGYHDAVYMAVDDSISFANQICMRHRVVTHDVTRTSIDASYLMHKVLENSVRNNPKSRPHEYKTYNKFTLETEDISKTKNKLNKFLRSFSLGIQEFNRDHHLIITESTSERKYKSELKEKETILASRVSGIDKPNLFTVTPKIQPFSLYDFYLGIASGHYRSPLTHGALHDYNFEIADTIITLSDTIYQVKFSPHKRRFFKSLRGVLFINKKHYGIQYAIMEPAKEANLKIRFVQSSRLVQDNQWFPRFSSTLFYSKNTGYNKVKIEANLYTVFYDVELDKYFPSNTFGEVVYDFSGDLEQEDSVYWNQCRKMPFSKKDECTYAFYDTIGTIKNFQNLLSLTEKLYLKQIPYKFLSFDLTKLININDYEGFRLGIGVHNSEQFSRRFTVGGYVGFGFSDGKGKYGLDGTIHMDYKTETDLTVSYIKDVEEAGAVEHSFDKRQFSSEWLRSLRVSKMDIVKKLEVSLKTHPFDYFQFETFFSNSSNRTPYSYNYKGLGVDEYHYTEVGVGFRYAFGEKYLKFGNNKLSLGSDYPVLWFRYTHGFDDVWDGDFLYNKYDIKINYNVPITRVGRSYFQMTIGHLDRDVPYFKMYNGKGNREVGAVAHNGFETMGYNEFLSSTYTALYYLHDFGKLHFLKLRNYTPKIEFAQNVGFGNRVDESVHQDIEFKTFEKGYFESGLILSNFIMFKAYVIKVGLGLGVFYRYGPYALPGFSDNTSVKASLEFQL